MHPKTLEAYQFGLWNKDKVPQWMMDIMAGPHHFHASEEIVKAADDFVLNEIDYCNDFGQQVLHPWTGEPPASSLVLTYDHLGATSCFLIWKIGVQVQIGLVCENEGGQVDGIQPISAYHPGGETFSFKAEDLRLPAHKQTCKKVEGWLVSTSSLRLSMIFSLINEPRLVKKFEATEDENSTEHQDRVRKITGKAAQAWTNVRWTVGKAVKAKGRKRTSESAGRPLHWCRAHWRSCKAGDAGAQWVERKSVGKFGWYKWIKDCWKGHPRYGIKLQRHEPAMPGEKRPGAVRPTSLVDQTRFLAMGAQQRAALVAAGFAPSSTIH